MALPILTVFAYFFVLFVRDPNDKGIRNDWTCNDHHAAKSKGTTIKLFESVFIIPAADPIIIT